MLKKILSKAVAYSLLLAAFSFLSANVDGQSRKDLRKARQLVEQGNKAFNQRNYRIAIDRYAEAIVLAPKEPAAHYWKGYSHYHLKEYDQALAGMEAALANGYKPVDVYKVRGFLYYEKKDYDAALADIRQGLQSEPDNLMFLKALGEITYAKRSYRESLDAFQKVVLIEPNNPEVYYNIALVQSNLGNVQGQASAAEEAVKRHTRFLGEALYLMGDAYQKLRKPTEAADAFQKSLAAKPDNYDAYTRLAAIYRDQSRFNDAVDVSKRALRAFPGDGNLYTNISWYYSLADRHEEAVQSAQAAVKLLPGQYLGYTNLCRAYNDTNQYQMAVTACNNALRLNPNDGETKYYLGRSYDFLKKSDEATKYYDAAVTGLVEYTRANPEYSDGFYLLGNAYFADNQVDKAIEAYAKCLELSPDFVKARFNLGLMHLQKKNKTGALEQYNSLMSLDQSLAARLKTEIDKL